MMVRAGKRILKTKDLLPLLVNRSAKIDCHVCVRLAPAPESLTGTTAHSDVFLRRRQGLQLYPIK